MRQVPSAHPSDEKPRTIAQITPEEGGSSKVLPWRPQAAWKPAGPQDATRLPYSQPWFRQGQTALDSCVKELREMRALVEVRTTERDHALNMAQEANEMWSRIKADNAALQKVATAAEERADAEAAHAESSARDAERARSECEQLRVEMGRQAAELARAQKETEDARREMEACKTALREMATKEAEEHAKMRRAEAELAATTELQMRMEAQRAAEQAAVKQAEVEKQVEEEAKAAMAREHEEKQRLRDLRASLVPDETRSLIETKIKQIQKEAKGGGGASAYTNAEGLTKFTDPEEIFKLMEGGVSGQGSRVTLVRASWLRAKQPRFLPANKADLPPEALIFASELRKIYRQTKTKQRLLPIITVLHPKSSPMSSDRHPDEDGAILGRIIEAIDMRWDQFTRKRGTGTDSGVADMGILFDWCALEEPTLGRARTEMAVEDFGMWYAHELITVWMLPEARDERTGRLHYTNGWSAFEYMMATTFKATTDLSGFSGAWPQLLDLDEELDFEHNERLARPAPAEPMVLAPGHELGDVLFYEDGERNERSIASRMYQKTLFEQLGSSPRLVFAKLGWGDIEVSRLSLVLPLCSSLLELNLNTNAISDKGIIALAESLMSLRTLELLDLSSNEIGDSGTSRLAGALTDGALQSTLKKLNLDNNHIGDKGAMTLASAISGGALLACKAVGLKGNPISPMAKKSVTKAVKKNKAPKA
jgi:hypothetical protein